MRPVEVHDLLDRRRDRRRALGLALLGLGGLLRGGGERLRDLRRQVRRELGQALDHPSPRPRQRPREAATERERDARAERAAQLGGRVHEALLERDHGAAVERERGIDAHRAGGGGEGMVLHGAEQRVIADGRPGRDVDERDPRSGDQHQGVVRELQALGPARRELVHSSAVGDPVALGAAVAGEHREVGAVGRDGDADQPAVGEALLTQLPGALEESGELRPVEQPGGQRARAVTTVVERPSLDRGEGPRVERDEPVGEHPVVPAHLPVEVRDGGFVGIGVRLDRAHETAALPGRGEDEARDAEIGRARHPAERRRNHVEAVEAGPERRVPDAARDPAVAAERIEPSDVVALARRERVLAGVPGERVRRALGGPPDASGERPSTFTARPRRTSHTVTTPPRSYSSRVAKLFPVASHRPLGLSSAELISASWPNGCASERCAATFSLAR
jgi:hypothetical protein